MARDPLAVLLRLREISLDAARRDLADRLRDEAAAVAAADALATGIARETARRAGDPDPVGTTDVYAAWLGRSQMAKQQAAAEVHAGATAAAQARESVNAERAAARALEVAMAQAEDRRRNAAARQEQQRLDEAGATRGRNDRWSG